MSVTRQLTHEFLMSLQICPCFSENKQEIRLLKKTSGSNGRGKLEIDVITKFTSLYALFWVIPRRLNFLYQRFETLCLSIFIGW